MTTHGLKPRLRFACVALGLVCLILGPGLSIAVRAQDSKATECTASSNSETSNCPTAPAAEDHQAEKAQLDWQPLKQVPSQERDRQCRQCEGRYVDPLAEADTGTAPENSEIRANADSGQLEGDEIIMIGGARVEQGYRRMQGDKVAIDQEQETATISGNVTLREPGLLLRGELAIIDSRSGEATVSEGEYVFHERHMHGSADLLERDTEGLVHIHNGKLTYCSPEEHHWAIRADSIELDFDEGLATARGAKIDVKDVPVFYTPYLSFPLDDRRRTGFLWPDLGNDSTGGLDITVPFYFNIAPNYDALYSPRFIEERGLNHELKLRYLNPLIGMWTLGGAYMFEDDKYEDQTPDQRSSDRWLAQVKQNGLFEKRWRSRIDYSKASDVDYLKDLETTSLESQRDTSLLQLGSLDYLGDSWLLNLDVQQFQSLADDIRDDYKKLPQFTATYWGRGESFTLEPVLLAQYSNFDTDEDRVTGQRMYGEAGIKYPMLWTYGYLTPTVKYRQLNYDLSEGEVFTSDSPSVGTPLASLDGGLYFDRYTSFRGNRLLQTLEPRLFYLYSDYEEQFDQPDFDSAELTFTYNQLFRETRFSGRDRLDDANQVSVGLTSRFINEETGRSLLSASLGQIYYFRDRKVRLNPLEEPLDDNGSEIAGEVSFTPNNHWTVRTNLIYDPFDGNMNSGNFSSRYRADNGLLFNVGYSYRRDSSTVFDLPATEEASISSYLPLSRNWSIFGAMNYSLEGDTSVEDMIGVEYDSCCWTFRLLHLRYYNNVSNSVLDFNDPDLERENTTQFQIILKGMGGYGDQITDIMQDMIRGFDERDY